MPNSASVSVLQITDLHLLPDVQARLLGVDTAASLDAVLCGALTQRAADALVVTGDIAHEPARQTYARARALIARRYRGPARWLAGNHDLDVAFMDERLDTGELRLRNWSIITIDTHIDGAEGGCVAAAELQRLQKLLAHTDARFVIVAGHHPPLELGTPWLDKGRIENGAELLEVLSGDARVKAYICGHVHQNTASMHRGLQILTTPSTCFQFVGGTPRFTVDATPPGWRWLELAADGTLSTRVGRANNFAVTVDLSGFKH